MKDYEYPPLALPASFPDNDRYEDDPYFNLPSAKPRGGGSARREMSLEERHADKYRNPSKVVYCKHGDAGGYPIANQQYRSVADTFARRAGGVVEDWAAGCWFKVGGKQYQVASDRNCIDVISMEPTQEQKEAMEILENSFSDEVKELFEGRKKSKKEEAA